MKCFDCGNKIEKKEVEHTFTFGNIRVKGKAYVCKKCGQSYTSSDKTMRIFSEIDKKESEVNN